MNIRDPLHEYMDNLRELSLTLYTNLEAVKSWMSTQHLHNELFLESINQLKEEVKVLKQKLEEKYE